MFNALSNQSSLVNANPSQSDPPAMNGIQIVTIVKVAPFSGKQIDVYTSIMYA